MSRWTVSRQQVIFSGESLETGVLRCRTLSIFSPKGQYNGSWSAAASRLPNSWCDLHAGHPVFWSCLDGVVAWLEDAMSHPVVAIGTYIRTIFQNRYVGDIGDLAGMSQRC